MKFDNSRLNYVKALKFLASHRETICISRKRNCIDTCYGCKYCIILENTKNIDAEKIIRAVIYRNRYFEHECGHCLFRDCDRNNKYCATRLINEFKLPML